ncbi:MAG TPA: ABC transporter ATP-binding protein [Acidimicrobiia bacterium]|nr:ABC transporter ATP-binding protein [Acidimicrobiia bacterium]
MGEPMISLRGVRKDFPGADRPAVSDLSFDVAEGEVVVLIGPSGCGKTTTLKMINRLIEPTRGSIVVAGRDIASVEAHELRRSIGYVIQQVGLFPHRTIADNIATVPRLMGWDRDRIDARVDELIDLVDLEPGMRDRFPAELSGGQRQRVGVARALAADPPVLLMDEPFGAVDPIVRSRLQDELVELQRRVRKTIVLVTHDIDEAVKLGDKVGILNVGGILEQYDSPSEILRSPANPFVEDFLGRDRGIKRLSLIPVRDVDIDRGPVVATGSSADDARAVMARHGVDWVGVVDGERILGWVWADDLEDPVTGAGAVPFAARIDLGESLREALDAVISSHTAYTLVCDGDRFVGMLTAETISREITE